MFSFIVPIEIVITAALNRPIPARLIRDQSAVADLEGHGKDGPIRGQSEETGNDETAPLDAIRHRHRRHGGGQLSLDPLEVRPQGRSTCVRHTSATAPCELRPVGENRSTLTGCTSGSSIAASIPSLCRIGMRTDCVHFVGLCLWQGFPLRNRKQFWREDRN